MKRTLTTMILTAMMATACAPDPMIDEIDESDTVRGPLVEGTNGSPGNNGLLVTTFQAKSGALRELMDQAIYADVPMKILNPNLITFLKSDKDARNVFDYAVRCALPKGEKIKRGFLTSYRGEGILNTTAQWKGAALDEPAKEDLFACIVAHLNPLGHHVPIFLSGQTVKPVKASTEYSVKEALWTTTLSEVGVTYHVWPLFPMPEMCAADPNAALKKRVCGHDAGGCFLDPRQNTFTDCILQSANDGGKVQCLGKNAIMTRLQSEDDFWSLYPDCFPPPPEPQ